MVGRHPTEPYEAFLGIYSPEGLLLERTHLGEIPPNRRRFFDVSAIAGNLVSGTDHLAVVNRVPSRLLAQASSVEDAIELPEEPDYSYFRSLLEYSYPHGTNGSVIYETPPRLNVGASSNTLSFTCQIVLSESVNSYVILVNHSKDPSYGKIASYRFGVYSLAGDQVALDQVTVGPFGIRVLDMAQLIPDHLISSSVDPEDHLAAFTFVGYSQDAALLAMVVNAAPELGAVAIEHTQSPQAYLLPMHSSEQRTIKAAAQDAWQTILPGPEIG